MKKILALMLALAMAFTVLACGAPAATTEEAAAPATEATEAPAAAKLKVCQITDTGGIDDKSFNATAWKGVQDSVTALGIEGKYLESKEVADYEKNINAFIEEKCDLIISWNIFDEVMAMCRFKLQTLFLGIRSVVLNSYTML